METLTTEETELYTDINGREYARMSELRTGEYPSLLEADGDFTCIGEGSVLSVKRDYRPFQNPFRNGFNASILNPDFLGLYVNCHGSQDEGGEFENDYPCRHYLDGQLMDDGDHLMGFYEVN